MGLIITDRNMKAGDSMPGDKEMINNHCCKSVCYICCHIRDNLCQRKWLKIMKNMKIDANGTEIRVMGDVINEEAYISLTDIAK